MDVSSVIDLDEWKADLRMGGNGTAGNLLLFFGDGDKSSYAKTPFDDVDERR